MLLSFRVANHKSLRTEQELNLRPVYAKGAAALTVAAVYGSNAAGKSNLLNALRYMRQMVNADRFRPVRHNEEPSYRTPFRLDPIALTEESSYVVDLELAGVLYNYGFAVDDERITEEWLYSYPQGRKRVLFERSESKVVVGAGVQGRRALQTLASKTRPNRLVLSGVDQFEAAEWLPVSNWFRRHLLFPQKFLTAAHNLRIHPELAEMLKVADVGIREVAVEEHDRLPSDSDLASADALEAEVQRLRERAGPDDDDVEGIEELIHRTERRITMLRSARTDMNLVFYHNRSVVPLSLSDQSEGATRFLGFMSSVLHALESGGTLLVDEIEASLHPRLLFRAIELFRDDRTNTGGGQLVFTTHDTSLLGTNFGDPILNRDEVWFTDKDKDGQTHLFPLSEFKPRKGENTERRYLGGSYGAVPAVFPDSLVEAVLTTRDRTAGGA